MSSAKDHLFADREKALEEEFFRKQDAKLIERLRATEAKKVLKAALSGLSGSISDSVVNALADLGVTAQAAATLTIVPLVAVAWADGSIEEKERKAILAAAAAKGIPEDGPGHALLRSWLSHKPSVKLVETWEEYVRALIPSLSPADRDHLRNECIGRAREVAQAAGGFLGIGPKVSAVEQDMLDRLSRAFAPASPG